VTATGVPGVVLAIDTSTSRSVLALGSLDGQVLAVDSWPAGYRHVEELLPHLELLLARLGGDRGTLETAAGIVVGTGPGAFTGLRVGLATAKALAIAFGRPLVAIGSGAALLAAAAAAYPRIDPRDLVLLLPAGPTGRYVVTADGTRLEIGGGLPQLPQDAVAVAVDLAGRASDEALARGAAAAARFPGMLLGLGATRLAAGDQDDPARVAPEYVSLPRGAAVPGLGSGGASWSPGRP
jgi:tRNA threonylcarbamoyladenosine biosynthesis protein TsaB